MLEKIPAKTFFFISGNFRCLDLLKLRRINWINFPNSSDSLKVGHSDTFVEPAVAGALLPFSSTLGKILLLGQHLKDTQLNFFIAYQT